MGYIQLKGYTLALFMQAFYYRIYLINNFNSPAAVVGFERRVSGSSVLVSTLLDQ